MLFFPYSKRDNLLNLTGEQRSNNSQFYTPTYHISPSPDEYLSQSNKCVGVFLRGGGGGGGFSLFNITFFLSVICHNTAVLQDPKITDVNREVYAHCTR